MGIVLDSNCESIVVSLETQKAVPAPFLTKTYELVDDAATDHIVSWGEDETTFVVWRPPDFARDLLPNYFKHNNFSSFVRQLNTYGFRKIVPDRWEFANDFFKKGEKHLLCEIHRRKTSHTHPHHQQLPSSINHNQNHFNNNIHLLPSATTFYHPFHQHNNRVSISPDSDELPTWCDSDIISNTTTTTTTTASSSTLTALSQDNERLRRSNNILMSELAHMKKLYNDIIYFVQNHVKPVAPSNTYSSSFILPQHQPSSSSATTTNCNAFSMLHKQVQQQQQHHHDYLNSPTNTSRSSITMIEDQSSKSCKTKLFGVSLQSNKKRVHPDYGFSHAFAETNNKARLVLGNDNDDYLGLNLMPPS
ncbi:heat stress transcription factor B-4 [Arachis duranensis]|uniref:Heat stress transcription factor B-4 n=1 Tax=Arachis duranensis TaxID=130453 RepID=A0A6P4DR61_ARADU|nr:heat stress transcription factor B-4 [Arachis duranensis]